MLERTLCTHVVKMIKASGGLAYKIPDDRLGISTQKPFDLFGVLPDGRPFYVEVKMVKAKRPTLPPSRINPHQRANLHMFSSLCPYALCGYIVGVQDKKGARVKIFFFELDEKKYYDIIDILIKRS